MENISKFGKQQNIKKPKELLGNWMEIFSLDVDPGSEVIPMSVLEYFLPPTLCVPSNPLLGCLYRL